VRSDPRHLGRVPVLVSRDANAGAEIPSLVGTARFLVPPALTVGQLTHAIRNRLALPPGVALFLLDAATGAPLPAAARVAELDAELAAAGGGDGILRVAYTGEAAFGAEGAAAAPVSPHGAIVALTERVDACEAEATFAATGSIIAFLTANAAGFVSLVAVALAATALYTARSSRSARG